MKTEILAAFLVVFLTLITAYLSSKFLRLSKATNVEARPKARQNTYDYVLERYDEKIKYYWEASRNSKNTYKRYRLLTVILGSLITLVSSLSASEFVEANSVLRTIFTLAVPIMAATLTIVSGALTGFHWGANWRDMVVNATKLEMERDRFLATPPDQRNYPEALEIMNSVVLEETTSFFQRVLDNEIKPKSVQKE